MMSSLPLLLPPLLSLLLSTPFLLLTLPLSSLYFQSHNKCFHCLIDNNCFQTVKVVKGFFIHCLVPYQPIMFVVDNKIHEVSSYGSYQCLGFSTAWLLALIMYLVPPQATPTNTSTTASLASWTVLYTCTSSWSTSCPSNTITSLPPSSSSLSIPVPLKGSSYTFVVEGVNVAGTGNPSPPATNQTLVDRTFP